MHMRRSGQIRGVEKEDSLLGVAISAEQKSESLHLQHFFQFLAAQPESAIDPDFNYSSLVPRCEMLAIWRPGDALYQFVVASITVDVLAGKSIPDLDNSRFCCAREIVPGSCKALPVGGPGNGTRNIAIALVGENLHIGQDIPDLHRGITRSKSDVLAVGGPGQSNDALTAGVRIAKDGPRCRNVPDLERPFVAGGDVLAVGRPRDCVGVVSRIRHKGPRERFGRQALHTNVPIRTGCRDETTIGRPRYR
jgi:hypothetical protein